MEYSKNLNDHLTTNFVKKEFDCRCNRCQITKHDPELSSKLQILRDYTGKEVIPTSGYRCPEHNAEVGGGTQSYHMKGMACDFVIFDMNVSEICKICEAIGFNGIGMYDDGYVHVDVRPSSAKYFWHNSDSNPVTTFGGQNLKIDTEKHNNSLATDIIDVLKKHGYI